MSINYSVLVHLFLFLLLISSNSLVCFDNQSNTLAHKIYNHKRAEAGELEVCIRLARRAQLEGDELKAYEQQQGSKDGKAAEESGLEEMPGREQSSVEEEAGGKPPPGDSNVQVVEESENEDGGFELGDEGEPTTVNHGGFPDVRIPHS